MQDIITSYTTESILTTLGFPDPLSAARQQARMMLLGRLAHYQATIQQFERTWECTLAEMSVRYESQGDENFEADDDYLEWQWCTDAVETVKEQLAALSVH